MVNKIRVIEKAQSARMLAGGWRLQFPAKGESEYEFRARLNDEFDQAKIYYSRTSIRGLYDLIAMVK